MNDTATHQGAAHKGPPKVTIDPDVDTSKEIVINPNPRTAQLEAMAERQEQARIDEIAEAVSNDPGMKDLQDGMNREIAESNAAAGIVHADPNDGAASITPIHEPVSPAPHANLPSNLQDDPLADFIVMDGAVPMVKAKVNGTDRLIPLADAKRQVQIGLSAEIRMQNAAEAEKIQDERANRLSAGEAALQARMNVAASQPARPAVPASQAGLTDEDLLAEATDIFNTAFSGTEEDAAKKLAKTLGKIRNSALARPVVSVDTKAIAREAASIATGQLTAQSRKKDVHMGYTQFQTNYPDIMADARLYKMADDMTDALERENPDWDMTQVMDEAGKRTRTWVKDISGQPQDTGITPLPVPKNQNSPVSAQTTETRLERKTGLVRMPTAAAGAQHHEPEDIDDVEQTPQEAFAQLKESRGQPV